MPQVSPNPSLLLWRRTLCLLRVSRALLIRMSQLFFYWIQMASRTSCVLPCLLVWLQSLLPSVLLWMLDSYLIISSLASNQGWGWLIWNDYNYVMLFQSNYDYRKVFHMITITITNSLFQLFVRSWMSNDNETNELI